MSTIKFKSLPYSSKTVNSYLIQIVSSRSFATEILHLPERDTNGNNWLAIKDRVEETLAAWLDEEPHTYIRCDMKLMSDFKINFPELTTTDIKDTCTWRISKDWTTATGECSRVSLAKSVVDGFKVCPTCGLKVSLEEIK